jgi:nucleotide-binding universal stress UspA family protein
MQFIQRDHDDSLIYGTPAAEPIAQAAKAHGIVIVMGARARSKAAASTWGSGSSMPTARPWRSGASSGPRM